MKEAARGAVIGAVGVGVTALLMVVSGHARFTGAGFDLGTLALGLLVFAGGAVFEEVVFRWLVLGGLVRLTGSAGFALVVSALAFGGVHLLTTSHATALSVTSNVAGGLMYGAAYLATGRRLWMPIGLHFAWNFVQGTVLGFTVSGDDDYSGALLHASTSGAHWLGGGGYGPEGSVFSLVGRAVIVGLVVCTAYLTQRRSERILLVSSH